MSNPAADRLARLHEIARLRAAGDPAFQGAAADLAGQHMRLAYYLAGQHLRRPLDADEAQEAAMGLLIAIRSWEPGHGDGLSRYARAQILCRLSRLRRVGWREIVPSIPLDEWGLAAPEPEPGDPAQGVPDPSDPAAVALLAWLRLERYDRERCATRADLPARDGDDVHRWARRVWRWLQRDPARPAILIAEVARPHKREARGEPPPDRAAYNAWRRKWRAARRAAPDEGEPVLRPTRR